MVTNGGIVAVFVRPRARFWMDSSQLSIACGAGDSAFSVFVTTSAERLGVSSGAASLGRKEPGYLHTYPP